MDGFVVNTDGSQRAIAPVERLSFVLGRLGERVVRVRGNEEFLRADLLANGFVHDSPNKLFQGSSNQRLGNRHFVTVVRERLGILQN